MIIHGSKSVETHYLRIVDWGSGPVNDLSNDGSLLYTPIAPGAERDGAAFLKNYNVIALEVLDHTLIVHHTEPGQTAKVPLGGRLPWADSSLRRRTSTNRSCRICRFVCLRSRIRAMCGTISWT